MTIAVLWWTCCVALLSYSVIGAVRLRAITGPRYARFVYVCVFGVAVLMLISGDWIWSLVYVPAALVVARLMIRRHDDQVRQGSTAPPAV